MSCVICEGYLSSFCNSVDDLDCHDVTLQHGHRNLIQKLISFNNRCPKNTIGKEETFIPGFQTKASIFMTAIINMIYKTLDGKSAEFPA